MNRKKITGSYYTPAFLANFVMSHVLHNLTDQSNISILEPSAGDGAFIKSFFEKKYADKFDNITFTAIEKNQAELDKARLLVGKKSPKNAKFLFRCENFLEWQKKSKGGYGLIIGNPPYVRRRYLNEDDVANCENIHDNAGLKSESIKNIWSAFLLKSAQLLSPNGIVAFVLPAELLQSNFTASIRDFLTTNFQRVEVFTFNELLFDAIGQDTVLLVGYKVSISPGTYYANIENKQQLSDLSFTLARNERIQGTDTKWTHHTLDADEIELIYRLKTELNTIDSYCESKPGIVTAANSFFIINSDTVAKHNLHEFTSSIIQKGFFVNGKASFDQGDLNELIKSKRPSKFLNFSKLSDDIPVNVKQYLEIGKNEDIPSRYKCLKRSKWYVVPNIPETSDGFFFKRTHRYPKLLKNEANVLVTDSAYQVKMRDGYDINNLVYSFYNSLTLVFSELFGRYYGGGVLELTPKEFKSLPIPYMEIDDDAFQAFKIRFKDKKSIDEVLTLNDEDILKKSFGYDDQTIKKIQVIREKLINKRFRKVEIYNPPVEKVS